MTLLQIIVIVSPRDKKHHVESKFMRRVITAWTQTAFISAVFFSYSNGCQLAAGKLPENNSDSWEMFGSSGCRFAVELSEFLVDFFYYWGIHDNDLTQCVTTCTVWSFLYSSSKVSTPLHMHHLYHPLVIVTHHNIMMISPHERRRFIIIIIVVVVVTIIQISIFGKRVKTI